MNHPTLATGYLVGAIVTLLLIAYLIYTLTHPEKF